MSLHALVTEARSLVEALPSGTVEMFLHVLTSKLTQYDQQLGRREAQKGRVNIYRLGHYLKAKQTIEDGVQDILHKDDGESLNRLKQAIAKNFDAGLPPVKAVLKQIDKFAADGKLPSLKGSR